MAYQGFVPPSNTYTYYLPSKRPIYIPKVDPITGQPTTSAQIHERIGMAIDFEAQQNPQPAVPGMEPAQPRSTFQNIVEPVTKAISGLVQGGGNALASEGVSAAARVGQIDPAKPPQRTSVSDQIAQGIVPQTPMDVGALAAAGPVGMATRGAGALVRGGLTGVAGAMGGATGAYLGGEDPVKGAAIGGAAPVLAEAGGKGLELTRRAITNLTGGLYRQDAAKIAGAIGDLVPSLQTHNAEELRDMVMSGKGKDTLLHNLMEKYDGIKQRLLEGTTAIRPGVPSSEYYKLEKAGYLNIPSLGGAKSFDEVRESLRDLFKRGLKHPENPTPGTLPSTAQIDAKAKFFDVMQEVNVAIAKKDPSIAKEFASVRQEFRIGTNILDMLHRANGASNRLFRPNASTVDFQTNRLQGWMSTNEAKLRQRMKTRPTGDDEEIGPQAFDAIAKEVFRGSPVGRGDTEGVSLGRIIGRQTAPLSGGAIIERFPAMSAPMYTGKPRPFASNPAVNQILGLLGIHTGASLLDDTPATPASPQR